MLSESLVADGSTPWIPLGKTNRIVIKSTDWSGAQTGTLEYSIDATAPNRAALVAATASAVYDIDGPGYVRLNGANVNDLTLDVAPIQRL